MRLPLFCVVTLAPTILAAALGDTATFISTVSVSRHRRGLDGYGLNGVLPMNGLPGSTTTQATTLTHAGETTLPTPDASPTTTSLNSLTSAETTTATTEIETKKKSKETISTPTGTSYSVIGSLPPVQTHDTASFTPFPTPNAPAASSPVAEQGSGAAMTGTNEWKIIGVAVIAFSSVAAVLLLSVFFDQWWHFLRDVFWRKRRGGEFDDQELVPDWEKAEWELRCGQDRHRYPSFTSLPSSLPSVPIVPAVPQPPQAALGKWGNVETSTRGPVRQLDGMLGVGPSAGSRMSSSSAGIAGVGVGLGIGRVGDGRMVSPRLQGSATASPRSQHAPRPGQGHASQVGNPFDDANSPMPDDVYVGVVH